MGALSTPFHCRHHWHGMIARHGERSGGLGALYVKATMPITRMQQILWMRLPSELLYLEPVLLHA
eukprot:9340443-Pyramimonas_sp.AAC.1